MADGYGESLIPLSVALAHLNIVDEDEDAVLIAALRDVGIDMVQQYCNVLLAETPGQIWRSESLPSGERGFTLGIRHVIAIESFTYRDNLDREQVLTSADYRIGPHGQILPAIGKSWPDDVGGAVEIVFTAGYAENTAPKPLIDAAKQFMAYLYSHRGDLADGMADHMLPRGFTMLCAAYRIPVI